MPQILRLYRELGLNPKLAPLTVDEFLDVVEIAEINCRRASS